MKKELFVLKRLIDGIDFIDMKAERYWGFPKNYKGDKEEETRQMCLSGSYEGSVKKDGFYYRFVKDMDGKCYLLSRNKNVNGVYTDKYDYVPHLHNFFDILPNGTVFIGEIYIPNTTSRTTTTIMNCNLDKALERQQAGQFVHYYIHNIYAWSGTSYLEVQQNARSKMLASLEGLNNNPRIEFAEYFEGQELLEEIGIALENGEEGFVITRKDALVEPGKRPVRKTLKIKQELMDTLDVFFTGRYKEPVREYGGKDIKTWLYWENAKTGEKIIADKNKIDVVGFSDEYKEFVLDSTTIEPVSKTYFMEMAGSLEIGCFKDGEVFVLGYVSGLDEELKRTIITNPKEIALQPISVTAMQFTPDGKLRHPVFVGFREDLELGDCTYEKIFGN